MMGSSSDSEGRQKIQLYSYWKSSCSWRVRIVLHLKGLPFEYKAVNLLKNENQSPEFLQLNPLGFVPVILDGDDVVADSLAIILYLDEKYPEPYLMPTDLQMGAINLQIANLVGSGIQPFQNISVLRHIEEKLGGDEKIAWAQKYIEKGFAALEKLLKNIAGKYATGDEIYLADIFLAPQIHAARTRFNVDMA